MAKVSTKGYKKNSKDKNEPYLQIPSGMITMKEDDGTPLRKGPILGIDNFGNRKLMMPGADYQFPGNSVYEIPMAQMGGPSYQLPPQYREALQNFVYPRINETDEYTGYNPVQGQINQDTRPGSIENNDWWMQHELLHHLQNLSGGMSSLGPLGKRPNLTTASNEAIEGYYNRRDNDVNRTIDNMIAQDPSLQFIPRDKLRNGSEPDENGHLSFVGAENLQYADPSTLEGEARQYEQYIKEGNSSIFPNKKNGGAMKRVKIHSLPKAQYGRGSGGPGGPGGPASFQDSLDVANSAQQVIDWYNSQGYYGGSKVGDKEPARSRNGVRMIGMDKIKKAADKSTTPTTLHVGGRQTIIGSDDLGQGGLAIDLPKFDVEIPSLSLGEAGAMALAGGLNLIGGVQNLTNESLAEWENAYRFRQYADDHKKILNTDAPKALYDIRIDPRSTFSLQGTAPGYFSGNADIVDMPIYEKFYTAPWSILSPEDKRKRLEYGILDGTPFKDWNDPRLIQNYPDIAMAHGGRRAEGYDKQTISNAAKSGYAATQEGAALYEKNKWGKNPMVYDAQTIANAAKSGYPATQSGAAEYDQNKWAKKPKTRSNSTSGNGVYEAINIVKKEPNANTDIGYYMRTELGLDKKQSSYSERKKLAEKYGIKDYSGTGKQNIELLNKIKSESNPRETVINLLSGKTTDVISNTGTSSGATTSTSNSKEQVGQEDNKSNTGKKSEQTVQSGARENYSLHETGNGGGAAYLYRTVYDENGEVVHGKSGNMGVVLTEDYLTPDQQKEFDSIAGGTARVDFNPNARMWHDLRQPLDIIEERRGTRKKALEMQKRNVDEVNAEKAAYEQYQQQQRDQEKARLKKVQEEIEAEKKAGGYAYGGAVDPEKPWRHKSKSKDGNYLYNRVGTNAIQDYANSSVRRTLKGFITGAPKPTKAPDTKYTPAKFQNGGTPTWDDWDKFMKLTPLQKEQLPLEEQDRFFRDQKLGEKRLDYFMSHINDPDGSSAFRMDNVPSMSQVDAELGPSPDIQYSYDGEVPYLGRYNPYGLYPGLGFTGDLPEARIPSGVRHSQNYIDWNSYDPELRNDYFQSRDQVNDFYRDWYTKRAALPQFTEVANRRLAGLPNVDFQPYGSQEEYDKDHPDTGGVYMASRAVNILPLMNSIFIPPSGFKNPSVMAHEESHYLDYNHPQNPAGMLTPAYNKEDAVLDNIIPQEYKQPSPEGTDQVNKASGVYLPFANKEDMDSSSGLGSLFGEKQKLTDYYYNPTEIRARLNEWRMQNNIDPVKDYTNEEIQSIIDADIKNNDGTSFDLYKLIRGRGDLLKKIHDSQVSTGNKKDPYAIPMGKKGGELPKAQRGLATAADSSMVANHANDIMNFYKSAGYTKRFHSGPVQFKPEDREWIYDNMKISRLIPGKSIPGTKYKNGEVMTTNGLQDPVWDTDAYQKLDDYKFQQRENANTILNMDSPMQLYDTRISPQYLKGMEDLVSGDQVSIYTYDKLAVTPWKKLTTKQRIQRLEKFGTSGSPYKDKASAIKELKAKLNPPKKEETPKQQETPVIDKPVEVKGQPEDIKEDSKTFQDSSENYTLQDSGNPGVSYLHYKKDNGDGTYTSKLLGATLTSQWLDDAQQNQFYSPSGGTARVNYNPDIKMYTDVKDAINEVEDFREQQKRLQKRRKNEASESFKLQEGGELDKYQLKGQVKLNIPANLQQKKLPTPSINFKPQLGINIPDEYKHTFDLRPRPKTASAAPANENVFSDFDFKKMNQDLISGSAVAESTRPANMFNAPIDWEGLSGPQILDMMKEKAAYDALPEALKRRDELSADTRSDTEKFARRAWTAISHPMETIAAVNRGYDIPSGYMGMHNPYEGYGVGSPMTSVVDMAAGLPGFLGNAAYRQGEQIVDHPGEYLLGQTLGLFDPKYRDHAVSNYLDLSAAVPAVRGIPRLPNQISNYTTKVGRQLSEIERRGRALGLNDFEIAQKQLSDVGITANQRRGYFPGASELFNKYVTPFGYTGAGESKIAQTLSNIKTNGWEAPRRAAMGNITAETSAAEANAIRQANRDLNIRDDAWRTYLGMPQKNFTFNMANTAPVMHPAYKPGSLAGMDIYNIPENRIFGTGFDEVTNTIGPRYGLREDGMGPLDKPILLDRDPILMGGYNKVLTKDGLQYNDIWDLDPTINFSSLVPKSVKRVMPEKWKEKLFYKEVPISRASTHPSHTSSGYSNQPFFVTQARQMKIPVSKFVGKPFMSHGNLNYTSTMYVDDLSKALQTELNQIAPFGSASPSVGRNYRPALDLEQKIDLLKSGQYPKYKSGGGISVPDLRRVKINSLPKAQYGPPDWRNILDYKNAAPPVKQNLVGDVRKVARPTAVSESTKVPTQKLPANFKQLKEEADANAAADRRMAEDEFVAKWDQVNGLTPRIPQPGDPDWQMPYPNDPAGLPSVPIFESLLMAPVALGEAGLAGLGEMLYGATSSSPLMQATGAGVRQLLNAAPKAVPWLNAGNALTYGFGVKGANTIMSGGVSEPWKHANSTGNPLDYADAVAKNLFTALEIAPFAGAIIKTGVEAAMPITSAFMESYNTRRALAQIQNEGLQAGLTDFEIAQRQLAEVGITSNQRQGYKPIFSELANHYLTPIGYSGFGPAQNKVQQTISNIRGGGWKNNLRTQMSKAAWEERLAENQIRSDGWRAYLGMPQQFGTFNMANTAPSLHAAYPPGSLRGMDIYNIPEDKVFAGVVDRMSRGLTGEGSSKFSEVMQPLDKAITLHRDNYLLGGYNQRLMENGLEYNDIWDIEPFIKFSDLVPKKIQGLLPTKVQDKLFMKTIPTGATNPNLPQTMETPRGFTVKLDKFIGKPFMSHGLLDYTSTQHVSNVRKRLLSEIGDFNNSMKYWDDAAGTVKMRELTPNQAKYLSDLQTKLRELYGPTYPKQKKGGETKRVKINALPNNWKTK